MRDKEKRQTPSGSLREIKVQFTQFGTRLRQIRKDRGMTQEQFAQLVGTSKQILSRYELGQRSPRIEVVRGYAEKLKVSVDYLLGDNETEAATTALCDEFQGKPFYEIFMDITEEQGLDIPSTVRITGLSERQVRTIIICQMKEAPLPIAMRLSETLNVPLDVWAGGKAHCPKEVSVEAYELARAYDRAEHRYQHMARMLLNLERV